MQPPAPRDPSTPTAPRALARWLGAALLAAFALGCGTSSSADCYEPGQEIETAYEPGTTGCACSSASDKPVCLQDMFGQNVYLICTHDAWQAAESASCPRVMP